MKGLVLYRDREELIKDGIRDLRLDGNSLTAVVFDKDRKYEVSGFDDRIDIDSNFLNLKQLLHIRGEIKKQKFDCAYIPRSGSESLDINLMLIGLFFSLCGIRNIHYMIGVDKIKFSRMEIIKKFLISFILWLAAPLVIILRSPIYFAKTLVPFMLEKNNKEDEITGFGPWKNFSTHVYFLGRAKMAETYGLFGINHRNYMGTPVTLHRSPLDVLFLEKIGFRGSIYLSMVLTSIALLWIAVQTGSLYLIALIPFIFIV